MLSWPAWLGLAVQLHVGQVVRLYAGREGSEPLLIDNGGEQPLKVWPVLCCAEGDIPWLSKLKNSIGHTGVHACYDCALEGIYHNGAKTVRYCPPSSTALPSTAAELKWLMNELDQQ